MTAADIVPLVTGRRGMVIDDHGNDSADSRHWGFVPVKYVLGRVAYRLTGSRRLSAVRQMEA